MQNNAAISAGQWWRLITPALLHMSLFHLAVNSMALHSLGAEVEGFSDQGRFLAIYTISAVTSFATSYALKPHHCQGSSGDADPFSYIALLCIHILESLVNAMHTPA